MWYNPCTVGPQPIGPQESHTCRCIKNPSPACVQRPWEVKWLARIFDKAGVNVTMQTVIAPPLPQEPLWISQNISPSQPDGMSRIRKSEPGILLYRLSNLAYRSVQGFSLVNPHCLISTGKWGRNLTHPTLDVNSTTAVLNQSVHPMKSKP